MADSATINHNFVLPEVGASKDSWGTKLNANFTQLDTLLRVGLGTFVNRAGDTMTGMLTLPVTVPTAGTHAANKSYVDTTIATNVANLNNALVPKTRTLSGGSGITTVIGDLSADRTISVDNTVLRTSGDQTVAGTTTFTAAPVVTAAQRISMPLSGNPTKELLYNTSGIGFYDRTNSRWDLQITPDGDLIPRGTLAASSIAGTLADARIPASVVRTSLTLAGGDGIFAIGDLSANRTISVDGSVVRTSRNVHSGPGLTGGGNLGADRTIELGTPSSITANSTNSVTSTSHTHAISEGAIRGLIAAGGAGQVGTYAILRLNTSTGALIGSTHPASNFDGFASGGGTDFGGASPTGTWKCMGYIKSGSASEKSTLFLKVA